MHARFWTGVFMVIVGVYDGFMAGVDFGMKNYGLSICFLVMGIILSHEGFKRINVTEDKDND